MAFPFVQGKASTAYVNSPFALAFTSNNTLGNTLVVAASVYNYTLGVTISDTQGNTYTHLVNDQTGPSGDQHSRIDVWYCLSCKAGANTVTITGATNSTISAIAEFTACTGIDQSGSGGCANNASSPLTTAPVALTTTNANEVIIAIFCQAAQELANSCNSPFGNTAAVYSGTLIMSYDTVSSIQTSLGAANAATSNTDSRGTTFAMLSFKITPVATAGGGGCMPVFFIGSKSG